VVVRRLPTGPLAVAMLATIAAAVLATQEVTSASLVLLGYVVCLSTCIVWWLLTAAAPAPEHRLGVMAALAPSRTLAPSPPLVRVVVLERLVANGMSSALDADARLRPALRDLARELLATRHGVEADEDDDVAALAGMPGEPLLGPRSARRPSATAPGPSAADVVRVLAHLESL
jgi:hypothetical protein